MTKKSWQKEFDKLTKYGDITNTTIERSKLKQFIKDLLTHKTKDGWCCACDYDIAVMEEKLKQQRESLIKEIEAWIVGYLPAFPPKGKAKKVMDLKLFSANDLEELINHLKDN